MIPSISEQSQLIKDSKTNTTGPKQFLRTPTFSKREKTLQFSSDENLRTKYRDSQGGVNIGLVLEVMDKLAIKVAAIHALPDHIWKMQSKDDEMSDEVVVHNKIPSFPVRFATASCEKVHLKAPIHLDQDLAFIGKATWAGNTSLEVSIKAGNIVETTQTEASVGRVPVTVETKLQELHPVLSARFIVVARSPKGGSFPIPELVPESDKEKKLLIEGQERADERQKTLNVGHFPNMDDEDWKPIEGIPLVRSNATKQETRITIPLNQPNIHNKISGGYMMREAYELALKTTSLFSEGETTFHRVDDTVYLAPVEVGNTVIFQSRITATFGKEVHTAVNADVVDAASGSSKTINTFHFNFLCPNLKKQVAPPGLELHPME